MAYVAYSQNQIQNISIAGYFQLDFCDTGVITGRVLYNTTTVTNCTFTASQNDYSDVMGIIGFNFYASLILTSIVVSNQVTFSWYGNGVLVAALSNASLSLQNSTLTSKVTIVSQNDY